MLKKQLIVLAIASVLPISSIAATSSCDKNKIDNQSASCMNLAIKAAGQNRYAKPKAATKRGAPAKRRSTQNSQTEYRVER